MKLAILSDMHSNLEALDSVLEDARRQGVDGHVCLGDIVGYNADPVACLERLQALDCPVVRGNHDHCCSHEDMLSDLNPLAARAIVWNRRQLSADQLNYLDRLPLVAPVYDFTIVHSTLSSPENWGYILDILDAVSSFACQTTDVCFHGHTHLPVIYEQSRGAVRRIRSPLVLEPGVRYLVNVGSVGQPRDGNPQAAYAIYDVARKTIELRRASYDIELTQRKIRSAGLPEQLARRLEFGQ